MVEDAESDLRCRGGRPHKAHALTTLGDGLLMTIVRFDPKAPDGHGFHLDVGCSNKPASGGSVRFNE